MVAAGILFFGSFLYLLVSLVNKLQSHYRLFKLGVSTVSLALAVYMFVLLSNEGVFYFPSPYNDGLSILNTVTAYFPIMLLVLIVPLINTTLKIIRRGVWKGLSVWLIAMNNLAYLVLLCLFAYWDLFDLIS
jgi:hypothetical protein